VYGECSHAPHASCDLSDVKERYKRWERAYTKTIKNGRGRGFLQRAPMGASVLLDLGPKTEVSPPNIPIDNIINDGHKEGTHLLIRSSMQPGVQPILKIYP
jgi:hypothetical protein